ncbi:unnamed protein product, partial [Brachionus calyciflorus]
MLGLIKIPKEIFKKLLFIENLLISDYHCYLEANDFSYLENLVYFAFVRSVQEIRPNAFNGLNNLVYLNLNYCYLSYLEEGCFDGLINLKFLNLHKNFLGEIRDSVFAPLKKLIHLDLSDNRIRNELNLNGLESLRYLNISSNYYQYYFNLSVNVLISLEALKYDRNLTEHRIDTEKLKYLCLSTFPTELSSNPNAFKSLEYLNINNLCKDNQFLDQFNFENLKVLIAEFDKIPKFGKNLRNLKYLKIFKAEEFDIFCFEYLNRVNNLKYFGIRLQGKAKSSSFSIKEPIFEKLIQANENLESSKSSDYFKSYVSDYKADPLEYVSDELRESTDSSI